MTTALLFLALLGLLALAIVAGLVVHHFTDGSRCREEIAANDDAEVG